MGRNRSVLLMCVVSLGLSSPVHADEKDAKQALAEHGIRVLRKNLALEGESQLSKSLRTVSKLRRLLVAAAREQQGIQKKIDDLKKYQNSLKPLHL